MLIITSDAKQANLMSSNRFCFLKSSAGFLAGNCCYLGYCAGAWPSSTLGSFLFSASSGLAPKILSINPRLLAAGGG